MTTYTYFEAILLGLIQGITEFLPVSSSGHLTLVSLLLGIEGPKLFFNVMLHAGTLIAVLFVFREDIWNIISHFFGAIFSGIRRKETFFDLFSNNTHFRLGVFVLLATIPTGILGFLLKDLIEAISTPVITGVFLLLSGVLLLWSKNLGKEGRNNEVLTAKDALTVGVVQGIAVCPGLSRSGSTIAFGLLLGLNQETAARFSFLLSIPAICGAIVLEVNDVIADPPQGDWGPIISGTLVSLFVGFAALKALLWLIRDGRFYTFAYYLFPVGLLAIFLGIWYA